MERIKKIARVVPYGYKLCDDDPEYIEPIEKEIEAIKKAQVYIQNCSYREVAQWLTATTGRYISHIGVKKVLDRHERNTTTETET